MKIKLLIRTENAEGQQYFKQIDFDEIKVGDRYVLNDGCDEQNPEGTPFISIEVENDVGVGDIHTRQIN